jgi:hypothetical protein
MVDEQWYQLDLFGLPPKAEPIRKANKPIRNTRNMKEWCTIFEFKTKEQALAFEAVLKSRFHFNVRLHDDAEAEAPAREAEAPPSVWIFRLDWPRRRGKAIKDIEPEVIKLARELGGIYDGD